MYYICLFILDWTKKGLWGLQRNLCFLHFAKMRYFLSLQWLGCLLWYSHEGDNADKTTFRFSKWISLWILYFYMTKKTTTFCDIKFLENKQSILLRFYWWKAQFEKVVIDERKVADSNNVKMKCHPVLITLFRPFFEISIYHQTITKC